METESRQKPKRRTGRIVLIAVLATLALCAASAFLKLFVIGSPVTGGVVCTVRVDGTHLRLDATETGSAGVISAIRFAEEDGVVTVRMRRVLVGIVSGMSHAEYEAADEIVAVRFCGDVLWSDTE